MNTYDMAEDALLAVSQLQRLVLTAPVAACYAALDNTGDGAMKTYEAWARMEDGAVIHTTLDEDQVIDMVELDPVDVDAAIEAEGWCGARGATHGLPFVLQQEHDTTPCEAAATYLRQG